MHIKLMDYKKKTLPKCYNNNIIISIISILSNVALWKFNELFCFFANRLESRDSLFLQLESPGIIILL